MKTEPFDDQIRKDNKIVSAWLLHYHERRQDYSRRKEEIIHSYASHPAVSVIRSRKRHGDPTGKKGEKLVELHETERWLELVEKVEKQLPVKLQVFLVLRREYRHARGRRGWTSAVQWKFSQEVAKRIGEKPEDVWVESRNTFTRWWDRIVEYAARLAAKSGLLK
ncbi:MAG: hypothetical protein ACYC0Q_15035 [Eubacteriales bacterium]